MESNTQVNTSCRSFSGFRKALVIIQVIADRRHPRRTRNSKPVLWESRSG